MPVRRKFPWRWVRLAAQWLCLGLFLYLFRHAEYNPDTGAAGGPWAGLFFRIDPLVAASAVLAGMAWISLLWPALVTLALTVVLGRFFCGWVCPLGTLLDGCHRLVPARLSRRLGRDAPHRLAGLRWLKFALLVLVLAAAVVGSPVVGYLDPFALLMRGLTLALDPALTGATTGLFGWLYTHGPSPVTSVSEPIYGWLQRHLLAFNQARFLLTGAAAAMLLAIFLLELAQRRFWCRNLCPLGAMLALASPASLARRLPVKACKGCSDCAAICRMGAFNHEGRFTAAACNECMDCVDACPRGVARLVVAFRPPAPAPLDVSRRGVLTACAVGLALPALRSVAGPLSGANRAPRLVRPPGALAGDDFLERCVRCGECMKVCPTHGLQPTLLECGVEGMFSPKLVARTGYCEYSCTLCGTACPTGAIRELSLPVKQQWVLGLAKFDEDLCLPYAKGEPCIVCEEHCPLPDKAIKLTDVEAKDAQGRAFVLQKPRVEPRLCIGCGICENKCPLEGAAGVRVENVAPAGPKTNLADDRNRLRVGGVAGV